MSRASRCLWVVLSVRRWRGVGAAAVFCAALGATSASAAPPQKTGPTAGSFDSCIACHSDPDLLVTNKKLYDYYQDYRASMHAQSGVGCADCHGGNATAADKDAAHGVNNRQGSKASSVNFKNIPETCGQCHDKLFEAYRKSRHYEQLTKSKQQGQGPNCITCHGSLNATKLNVNTVRDICTQCHNNKSGNHPEIPETATHLLHDLNVVRAFSRYVRLRAADPTTSQASLTLELKLKDLAVVWHAFDLPKVAEQTKGLLEIAKQKRQEAQKVWEDKKPTSPAPQ